MGEVVAKLLAAGGAEVVITYYRGDQDAKRIVAEILAHGAKADCLPLNVLEPSLALAGMVAGFFVSGCAVGLLLASAYGRAKAGKHPAFALHLLYWHLPAFMTGLKRTPPSYLRELAG